MYFLSLSAVHELPGRRSTTSLQIIPKIFFQTEKNCQKLLGGVGELPKFASKQPTVTRTRCEIKQKIIKKLKKKKKAVKIIRTSAGILLLRLFELTLIFKIRIFGGPSAVGSAKFRFVFRARSRAFIKLLKMPIA